MKNTDKFIAEEVDKSRRATLDRPRVIDIPPPGLQYSTPDCPWDHHNAGVEKTPGELFDIMLYSPFTEY